MIIFSKMGFYFMISLIFLLIISMPIISYLLYSAKENACIDLGYKGYKYREMDYCIDHKGDYHYVDWEFERFPDKVSMWEISIMGDKNVKNRLN